MPRPDENPADRAKAISAARNAARRAAITLARDAGAPLSSRPFFPGAETTVQDVEPLTGMRAAREVELGARHTAHGYIRDAREAGHDWHQIGTALGLAPGADADQVGQTIGEAAYTYAAGRPDTETARHYGRSFAWSCTSCDHVVSDQGLCNGPAEDERGHGEGCSRLAATVAAADAEWAAAEAEWEAGQ